VEIALLTITTTAVIALVGATWRLGTINGQLAGAVEDLASDVKVLATVSLDHEKRLGHVEGRQDSAARGTYPDRPIR
jgi:hypothetical protein